MKFGASGIGCMTGFFSGRTGFGQSDFNLGLVARVNGRLYVARSQVVRFSSLL